MVLAHSDAILVKAYPAETTEAFCDAHSAAFAFFGGVPLSVLYDNTAIAIAKICGPSHGLQANHCRSVDGSRERTRTFSELQSHYLFDDKFGRPVKGNDKGHVEGCAMLKARLRRDGYGRRNFMVPAPRFESFDALNAWLEDQCLPRQNDIVRGHSTTIGERLPRDLAALMARPTVPYDACEKVSTRATSISIVRYRANDHSVPVAYAHHEVQVRGYVHEVVIGCGPEVLAGHKRSYDKVDTVYDPMHVLPLLEQKVGALDQAAHYRDGTCPLSADLRCKSPVGQRTPSQRCTGFRRPEWANQASANTSRFCGGWKPSRWALCMVPFVRPLISAPSAMTPSSTWCCAGLNDDRPSWISMHTLSCPPLRSKRQRRPATRC